MSYRIFEPWGLLTALTLLLVASWLLSVTGTRDDSPAKSMTLEDVQRRHEAMRSTEPAAVVLTPAAQLPAPALPPIAPPDRWTAAVDPSDRLKIGLRFRASESVTEACAKHELWNDCSKLNGFLERMRAEPRDAIWARKSEARIERAAYEGERGQYRIRALECRNTRCALEVVSESRTIGISYVAAYDDGLSEGVGTIASEYDPQTGISTLVFVQVWQKREASLGESRDE